jgi:hypothetical protein
MEGKVAMDVPSAFAFGYGETGWDRPPTNHGVTETQSNFEEKAPSLSASVVRCL